MSARSHLRDSFRVVLFGLAVVFAASAELWAETLAVLPQGDHEIRITGPDEIELEFNAIRDADNVFTRCSSNGLRGGIECGVNRRLDDSETLGGGRIQAKLRVQIPPEIRDGQNPEARLLVGPPVLTITGADPELERRIRQEAGRIMIGLSLWQDRLSREKLTTLMEAGVMEAPIDSACQRTFKRFTLLVNSAISGLKNKPEGSVSGHFCVILVDFCNSSRSRQA